MVRGPIDYGPMSQTNAAVCPYCGYSKDESEFTDEHVLPKTLGGNLEPTNPFICRVCRGCNNACGRWVDGRFAKSWIISNWKVDAVRASYDPSKDFALMPAYMGQRTDWDVTGSGVICDFWLGPTGDHVHHFHNPYPEGDVFAGRPPHLDPKTVDAGTVFISVVGTNPLWHPIVHRGVVLCFGEHTPIHFVNAGPEGAVPPYPPVTNDVAQKQFEWILGRPMDKMVEANMTIDVDWGVRFLVKFALGLGTVVLGDSFVVSDYARLLRTALWERDHVARGKLAIRGTPFLGGAEIPEMCVPQCHTIFLMPTGDTLAAFLSLYGRHQAIIQVSDKKALWEGKLKEGGMGWVVAPAFRRFAGPGRGFDIMDDTSKLRTAIAEILKQGQPLPPFHM